MLWKYSIMYFQPRQYLELLGNITMWNEILMRNRYLLIYHVVLRRMLLYQRITKWILPMRQKCVNKFIYSACILFLGTPNRNTVVTNFFGRVLWVRTVLFWNLVSAKSLSFQLALYKLYGGGELIHILTSKQLLSLLRFSCESLGNA